MTEPIGIPSPPPASLAFDAPCRIEPLTLPDGYVTPVRWLGEPPTRRATLYLHGIQSHGGWFLRSAAHLAAQGHVVLLPERRGSGLNTVARGHADSPEQLINDTAAAAEQLRQTTGVQQIDLLAVSWSGKLALACADKYPEMIRQVTLVAPGLRPRIDIGLREKISVGFHGILANPKKPYDIPLTEPRLFTANADMRNFLKHDPLMLKQATAAFFVASKKLDHRAAAAVRRLAGHVPVRLFLAGRDRIIDNQATIDLLAPALSTPARCYEPAEHTLDFEQDPTEFLADLTQSLET